MTESLRDRYDGQASWYEDRNDASARENRLPLTRVREPREHPIPYVLAFSARKPPLDVRI